MHLAASVKEYLGAYLHERPDVPACCPTCRGIMSPWGRYFRYCCDGDDLVQVPIYRYRCSPCNITCSLLPCFLSPYLPHPVRVREHAMRSYVKEEPIEKVAEEVDVEPRTVSRWVKRLSSLFGDLSTYFLGVLASRQEPIRLPKDNPTTPRKRIGTLLCLAEMVFCCHSLYSALGVFGLINLVTPWFV